MDRKQLVTIAITAVLSVIAKEFFNWFVAWAKIKAQTDTAKAKARTIFNKTNRKIILYAAWFALSCHMFAGDMHDTRPITRMTIVLIILSTLGCMTSLVFLFGEMLFAIVDWRERRKAKISTQV
jgi:hypothetical protein